MRTHFPTGITVTCIASLLCVCTRINQRKWVWPTFTQLSGHQGAPASSLQMPQLLACDAWERRAGVRGRMCGKEQGGWQLFLHHVRIAKRPGLRNYWCGTWNTWKRFSFCGECFVRMSVMRRNLTQYRVCLGISEFFRKIDYSQIQFE